MEVASSRSLQGLPCRSKSVARRVAPTVAEEGKALGWLESSEHRIESEDTVTLSTVPYTFL